jgi:hypothetical protein
LGGFGSGGFVGGGWLPPEDGGGFWATTGVAGVSVVVVGGGGEGVGVGAGVGLGVGEGVGPDGGG